MDQQGEKAPSGVKAGAEEQPQRCMTGPEKTISDTTVSRGRQLCAPGCRRCNTGRRYWL